MRNSHTTTNLSVRLGARTASPVSAVPLHVKDSSTDLLVLLIALSRSGTARKGNFMSHTELMWCGHSKRKCIRIRRLDVCLGRNHWETVLFQPSHPGRSRAVICELKNNKACQMIVKIGNRSRCGGCQLDEKAEGAASNEDAIV